MKNESTAPISEHPKPKVPHVGHCQHVQQTSRILEVDVVVCASVGEEIVDLGDREHNA
jgi:hypothetical protein